MALRLGTALRWVAGALAVAIGSVGSAALASVLLIVALAVSGRVSGLVVLLTPLSVIGLVALPLAAFLGAEALDLLPPERRRRGSIAGTTLVGAIGVGAIVLLIAWPRLFPAGGGGGESRPTTGPPSTTPPTMTFPSTTVPPVLTSPPTVAPSTTSG